MCMCVRGYVGVSQRGGYRCMCSMYICGVLDWWVCTGKQREREKRRKREREMTRKQERARKRALEAFIRC